MGLLVKPKSPNLWKLLQRREFPKLYALASGWVATPLLYICTLVYLQNAIFQPAASTFPIGLSAFGVTAALSGICFSMARACENPGTAKYAGEKFLHSAILLIQGLFLIYLRDAVGESNLLKPWPYLIRSRQGVCCWSAVPRDGCGRVDVVPRILRTQRVLVEELGRTYAGARRTPAGQSPHRCSVEGG
jgi:hypothetical protein